MKESVVKMSLLTALASVSFVASAQYRTDLAAEDAPKTDVGAVLEKAESSDTPVVITLEQALEIALSENVAVKVSDMEIKRTEYAKRGSYASLFPQIDASGMYQRTIKKQVMYMDFDMSSIMGGGLPGGIPGEGGTENPSAPDTQAPSK